MSKRDNQPPFGGRWRRDDDDDLPLDVEKLLREFPQRLNRLKEASGLSWSGLARILGVDRKQTRRWGGGTEPRGGSVLSVFHFGNRIPGGLDILLGLLTDPDLPDDEEDKAEQEGDEEENEEQEG